MDIIIVSTSTKQQERFWQDQLESKPRANARVVVVHEDWKGGAGNGLGSLYAYKKGRDRAKNLYGIDILKLQKEGCSVAIFHTAGKGTRLSPLTFSESNNKSAVQLPGTTVLEAVISQNLQLSPSRLAIIWGDQIFIPEKNPSATPSHHIEILAKQRKIPTQEEWEAESLYQYGWVTLNGTKPAKLLDKCDFPFFQKWIQENKISLDGSLGISLGCFNLSFELTEALLSLFDVELQEKNTKMDSDPFFWMPSILDRETYIEIMLEKGYALDFAEKHYERMQKFKDTFCKKYPKLNFFGAFDIGPNSFWWDYGTVENYYSNMMKLIGHTAESERMRRFFNVDLTNEGSCVLNCAIKDMAIKNSVLIDVEADQIHAEHCLIVDSKFKNLKAFHSLLYKVTENEPFVADPGTVRSDVFVDGHHIKMYTSLGRDGKADWDLKLPGNMISYGELYSLVAKALN